MNQIKCDDCKTVFIPQLKDRKIKNDIEQMSFICPNCKRKYVVLTTNTEIRKFIKKRKMLAGFAKEKDKAELNSKMKEYAELGEEIKSKSRALTAKVEAENL